jgi:hypothetical protein
LLLVALSACGHTLGLAQRRANMPQPRLVLVRFDDVEPRHQWDARAQEINARHLEFLRVAERAGELRLGGVLSAPSGGGARGGVVGYCVRDADDLRRLVDGDPAVSGGLLRAEAFDFDVYFGGVGGSERATR